MVFFCFDGIEQRMMVELDLMGYDMTNWQYPIHSEWWSNVLVVMIVSKNLEFDTSSIRNFKFIQQTSTWKSGVFY